MIEITTLKNSAQEIHDSIRDMMEPLEQDATSAEQQYQVGVLKLLAKIAFELEKLNSAKPG